MQTGLDQPATGPHQQHAVGPHRVCLRPLRPVTSCNTRQRTSSKHLVAELDKVPVMHADVHCR